MPIFIRPPIGVFGLDSPYGSTPKWSIGFGIDNPNHPESNYRMSQLAWGGIDRAYYDKGTDTGAWRQANRAVLKVPFGRFYDDAQKATPHLTAFRRYIDGIEKPTGNNPTH